MRFSAILVSLLGIPVWAGQAQQAPTTPPSPSSSAPQTETVEAARPMKTPPPAPGTAESAMTPAEVKELSHRIWLAEYRINDLLTEVRPERWKLSEVARNSFNQTLATLRGQLTALDGWRSQLDERPDSMYLGYVTYSAINAVLPRLDAVTRSITQRENASLGAQFSQAGNQLFDLQQKLQPYLAYLLHNQDEALLATQNNLAACQNQLSFAMRGKNAPARPMKNILPEFKGRRVKRSNGDAGQPITPQLAPPPTAPPPKKP